MASKTSPAVLTSAFVLDLNEKLADEKFSLSVLPGRKYDKVVATSHGSRSVYAFVEAETGALLKAEGWAKPAKGVRYDLSTPEGYALALEKADKWGGFLYR